MKQHAIPRFYLRQFTPPTGQQVLWEYSKEKGTCRRMSPRTATVETHLYSAKKSDGSWDETLELQLGKIEEAAAEPLKKLSSSGVVAGEDRDCISLLMGAMFLRVQGLRQHAAEQARIVGTVAGLLKYLETQSSLARFLPPHVIAAYKAHVVMSGHGVQLPPQFHMIDFLHRAKRFADGISQMTWTVFMSSRDSFFATSDNPVFARRPEHLLDPGLVGIRKAELGVELGFPVSRASFLIASWSKLPEGMQDASADKVLELNTRTVISAHSYVFSPYRSPELESLLKAHAGFRLAHPKIVS